MMNRSIHRIRQRGAQLTAALLIGLASTCLHGCAGIVDREANEALMQQLGETSITVFPTFVRGSETSHDQTSAQRIAAALEEQGIASTTVSDAEIAITGPWRHNEARMLRDSAEQFGAYLRDDPIETDYALLAEYLIGGHGSPVGIHCYLLDDAGTPADAFLLNSHHEPFKTGDPQTIEDCTDILIGVLTDDLKPAQAATATP